MSRRRSDMRLPDWMRTVPRYKPAPGEPGRLKTHREETDAESIIEGSERLLSAIWQRHQRVMLVAKACGRNVVIPDRSAA